MSTVIDMKTKRPLFSDNLQANIADSLRPFTGEDELKSVMAANAVEQVLCAAIINSAKELAVKLANKVFDKLTTSATTEK